MMAAYALGSRTVDWWSVHDFVIPLLTEVGTWPVAGTIAWIELDDTDPRKLAAVLDAGRHWALRIDSEQELRAQAAKDVAAGENWAAMATSTRNRAEFYAARPWLKRVAS
jgi:hypothetical protein